MKQKLPVTYREAFWVWVKIALLSFGGPTGQIAVMHRILVDEKKWVTENRFLHALNYCMLLPGPEAQQLATYIGWLLHGTRGGLTAGLLFILPGFISILALSILYAYFQEVPLVEALLFGLKAAVLAIVLEALIRISKRVLKNQVMVAIAVATFCALFFFNVPFPAVILVAGLLGLVGGKISEAHFCVIKPHATEAEDKIQASQEAPSVSHAIKTALLWGSIWALPLVTAWIFLGLSHVLLDIGSFFSKAAMITFGGAYAVLAYIAQQAVHAYGWLSPGEMLDGLGMAETTPGPLIQVVQFVGFLAAFRNPEPFSPLVAGILGSVMTAWVTFAPCFLWIFLGAPYIERLRGNKLLSSALSSITAAVVGVILNLAIWFGLHVLFGDVEKHWFGPLQFYLPKFQSLQISALLVFILTSVSLLRFKIDLIVSLLLGTLIGMLLTLI